MNKQTQRSSRGRRAWLPSEDRALIDMKSAGNTHVEIAVRLERSWNSVQQRHSLLRRQGRI